MQDDEILILRKIIRSLYDEYMEYGGVSYEKLRITPLGNTLEKWRTAMIRLQGAGVFNFIITDSDDVLYRGKFNKEDERKKWFYRIYDFSFGKLEEFCKSKGFDLDNSSFGSGLLGSLEYSIGGVLIVTISNNRYKVATMRNGMRIDKILSYIFNNNLLDKRISKEYLMKKVNIHFRDGENLNDVFKENVLRSGCLKPFAIIEPNFLIIKSIVELSEEEMSEIKINSKE